MAKMLRQGDVLLIPAPAEVVTARHAEVPRKNGVIVLAEGEATGHAHAIHEPHARLLESEGAADRVLVAEGPCVLVHEEHDAIPIAEGVYVVRRQREYVGDDEFAIVSD
jgi:hypothetical protein